MKTRALGITLEQIEGVQAAFCGSDKMDSFLLRMALDPRTVALSESKFVSGVKKKFPKSKKWNKIQWAFLINKLIMEVKWGGKKKNARKPREQGGRS